MIGSVEQTGDLQVPSVTVTGGEIVELQQFSHRQHLSPMIQAAWVSSNGIILNWLTKPPA